ncbi:MAG TPA: sigma factor-like helix-turn-helix DNA-binding protein [Tepidisphaeraceae bacterium]
MLAATNFIRLSSLRTVVVILSHNTMLWNLTDEDLYAAQAGDAVATERLFAAALPPCGRLAATLCGDDRGAARALQRLVDRSVDQLRSSRDSGEAGRWFMHQTVLLTREQPQPTNIDDDTLMAGVGGPDVVAYRALIAGLRKLPRQQQEALLLRHAEDWNTRLCAVAMDCSTQAVQTHLDEATRQLTPLAGGHFTVLMSAVRQVHQSRPLNLPQTPAMVAARVRRRRWTGRLLRLAGWTLIVGFLLLLALATWWLRGRIKI